MRGLGSDFLIKLLKYIPKIALQQDDDDDDDDDDDNDCRGGDDDDEVCLLFELYVLATSRVTAGWLPTCHSAHSW